MLPPSIAASNLPTGAGQKGKMGPGASTPIQYEPTMLATLDVRCYREANYDDGAAVRACEYM